MTLIKSISGIRGTIGGKIGDNLTPIDLIKFTASFAKWCSLKQNKNQTKILVGRDARISGDMVNHIVLGTLSAMGVEAVDIGLASTPTTELAVVNENADGGIILTASHNPKNWNALKLLNNKGEFISDLDGKEILNYAERDEFDFVSVDKLGKIYHSLSYDEYHIQQILQLQLVDVNAISLAQFKIAVDGINSVGGIVIPKLLEALGVKEIVTINCEPTGDFGRNPEPLPENLNEISKLVKEKRLDLGIVVDPDVDRLAIISEDGSMFGEEYTLVAVADYILQNKIGNTVSNLSSTKALKDITLKYGGKYYSAAVGEVNVVSKMKECRAVIGGEGNGGIIFPELHYGRDALVGVALFLSYLAKSKNKCSELKKLYPEYFISKNKIQLTPSIHADDILKKIETKFRSSGVVVNTLDGVKLEYTDGWVHLRKSNTEPIIRIYAEHTSKESSENLAQSIIDEIKNLSI